MRQAADSLNSSLVVVLTGLNEAFVVDRATRDRLIAEHPSSAEVLKPFLRGRDVKRWRAQFAEQYLIKLESSENKQHLWSGKPDLEVERVFASRYPAIHHWFEPLRAELIKRSDQGQYFWELRSCAYWQEFEQPKIIIPAISATVAYAPDLANFYSNDKTSICVTDQTSYLAGLLNSSVLWYLIRQTAATKQGGYFEFKPMYVSQLPIPVGSNTEAIAGLVERVLALTPAAGQGMTSPPPLRGSPLSAAERGAGGVRSERGKGGEVAALEREIDERVYALYGLRPDEIRLIEEQVRGGAG